MSASLIAAAGSFEELELREETKKVLRERFHFDQMTPVQAATLPKFLQHKDVAVEAPTGSGKTLAFVIPVMEKLLRREDGLKKNEVGAIIITPTRELAQQIHTVTKTFTDDIETMKLHPLLLVGGTSVDSDLASFRTEGGHILIATPGRLDDILNRLGSEIKLKELEVLILDEADRLLDMGFHAVISSIIAKLPKQRRTGLFSATQTQEVAELMKAGMRNPVKVVVKVQDKASQVTQAIPVTLQNYYSLTELDEKFSRLVKFMVERSSKKVIVYFLTVGCVNFFWRALRCLKEFKDTKVLSLHGHMPQKKRLDVYTQFVSLDCGVLLSTDVSARGLDFQDVDWIVQFDPPQDPNFFVHRIGRTARIGRAGNAIVFLLPQEAAFVEFLNGRGVPITEKASDAVTITDDLPRLKAEMMTDREFLEKSHVAFVSYIRAYKEHKLNYIFRLQDLDFGKLARLFCLLRLPRVKELHKVGPIKFEPTNVDLDKIPYKDKRREKHRQEKLQQRALEAQQQKEAAEAEETDDAEIDALIAAEEAEFENVNEVDEDELAKEVRLLKRLKKGKISRRKFEEELGDDALDKEFEAKAAQKFKSNKDQQHGNKRPNDKKRKRSDGYGFAGAKKAASGDHQKRSKFGGK